MSSPSEEDVKDNGPALRRMSTDLPGYGSYFDMAPAYSDPYDAYVALNPTPATPHKQSAAAARDDRVLLGEGAFGKVYRGRHQGRDVAIKTMVITDKNKAKQDSFLWEANRLRALAHPSIVELIQARTQDNELQLLLEFCSGGSLEDVLGSADHKALQLREQWRILLEVCTAVDFIHSKGMIHKDLKSENCLLQMAGNSRHLKLADLGVSPVDRMLMGRDETTASVVERGLKDLYWASPEEANDHHDDNKLDMFAIGLIAVHMVTGKLPWSLATQRDSKSKDTLKQWLDVLRQGNVQDVLLQHIPQDHVFHTLIKSCLSVDKTARPTAAQAVEALKAPELVLRCFDGQAEQAGWALVEYRNRLLIHSSRTERDRYIAPFTTPKPYIQRVPTSDSKVDEEAAELSPTPDTVSAFVQDNESPHRTLVLLGDGGTGKSLTSHYCASSACPALEHRLLFVRPGLERWSHNSLANSLDTSAANLYGLSADMLDAMRNGKARAPVFWFDAYDELVDDVDGKVEESLPVLAGIDQWPFARIIVTCRRTTVPESQLFDRFGVPDKPDNAATVRYLLPFSKAQCREYLSQSNTKNTDELDDASLDVLSIPFVLRLYADSTPEAKAVSDASEVYNNALTQWGQMAEAGINSFPAPLRDAIRDTLVPSHLTASVLGSFVILARVAAEAMWRTDKRSQGTTTLPHDELVNALSSLVLGDNAAVAPVSWLAVEDVQRSVAGKMYDQGGTKDRLVQRDSFIALQQVQWNQRVLAGCPLQRKDSGQWSFIHKSFRDFFVSQAVIVAVPADMDALKKHIINFKPVTVDPAVQQLASQAVDPAHARKFHRRVVLAQEDDVKQADTMQTPSKQKAAPFVECCWSVFEHKTADVRVAAANVATILNSAGVSLAGVSFRGCWLGDPTWPEKFPFVDFSGAMLQHADFTDAVLCGATLQQSCLDHANLTRANLNLTFWGEKTRLRTPDMVEALATSLDGKHVYAAVGSSVLQYSADTGAPLHTFLGPDSIRGISLSRDNSQLFASCFDGTVIQWNVITKATKVLSPNDAPLPHGYLCVAVSANGARVYAGSVSMVDRWDAATGKFIEPRITSLNRGPVDALVVTANEDLLFAGGRKGYEICRVRLTEEKPEVTKMQAHDWGITVLALSPDDRFLFSGSMDKTVRQWDVQSGALLRTLQAATDWVVSLALTKDARNLFWGSSDAGIRQWDVDAARVVRSLHGHNEKVNSLALSPDETCLYSGAWDNTLRRWLLNSRPLPQVQATTGHASMVHMVLPSPDGKCVVTASDDNTIKLWAGDDGALLNTYEMEGLEDSPVHGGAWLPDSQSFLLVQRMYRSNWLLWFHSSLTQLGKLTSPVESKESSIIAFVAMEPTSTGVQVYARTPKARGTMSKLKAKVKSFFGARSGVKYRLESWSLPNIDEVKSVEDRRGEVLPSHSLDDKPLEWVSVKNSGHVAGGYLFTTSGRSFCQAAVDCKVAYRSPPFVLSVEKVVTKDLKASPDVVELLQQQ